ncbi:winged helix-turn-helix transcriptional regulator [Variovorax sp. PBS-H4]|uniref:winged helix-turn-helix transcriptional regulator n=1 Tax=Variovorax sp. PBS-H4 TaxID=434008 RepID=UPI0013A58AE6|nr:helix-turn-helix domain-containing protein [Variovorax sp. PBS-H4]
MSQQACDALSDEDDGLKREILAHAGSRWSLGIVHALATAGTLRHAVLARRLEGITQRMLTRTLRHLERDGMIARDDYGEVSPRVEYSLTDVGRGFLASMIPLWGWILDHSQELRAAREQFDRPPERGDERPGTVVHRLSSRRAEPRSGLGV